MVVEVDGRHQQVALEATTLLALVLLLHHVLVVLSVDFLVERLAYEALLQLGLIINEVLSFQRRYALPT